MRRLVRLLPLVALAACENPTGDPFPQPDPVRTVVYKRVGVSGLFAVRADGTGEVQLRLPAAADAMTQIGMSRDGDRLALLGSDRIIYVYQPADSTSLRGVLGPLENQILPPTISDDGRYLALVVFEPTRPRLIVADLTLLQVDTLPAGVPQPALPPIFSPDNSRIAVIGVNSFTLEGAFVERTTGITSSVSRVGGSRLLDIPVFGWPRWTASQGILLAVRRKPFTGETGPDTLFAVSLDPADFEDGYRRRFAAISRLAFDDGSTFAYSSDGNAVIYGAFAPGASTQGLFFQSANTPEVRIVVDEPTVSEVFPLMVNGTLPVPLR